MSGSRTPCVDLRAVLEVLSAGRFDMSVEVRAQDEMERALLGVLGRSAISREHRLGPGDRPDFLIDGWIVVEVKGPRHRAPAVLRQLGRYADYPEVEAIVLATARAMVMPAFIADVPVTVINLGRAWL